MIRKIDKLLLLFVLLLPALLLNSCSRRSLMVDESYAVLKPVKQLELPEQVSENLIVKIANVADEGSSYKNHLDLYINGKLVKPNWVVSNIERTYTYKLRLRPGYYNIKANYYAYVGWGEEKYPIEAKDLVPVFPNKKTVLFCSIQKEANGVPVNKKMYFKKEVQPLAEAESSIEIPEKTVIKGMVKQKPTPVETPQPIKDVKANSIVLQINTVPENASIIIDDKTVGQSPLKILVDRNSDHVVQISADGYKTAVKFLDHTLFGKEKVIHILQELETK